mmetsp:Transcript_32442/g.52558  ORF Transcript_32442/g.52558 Transcript_32442/m.52558 type:complete len:379 (-) Transcript_32442:110-1246(-)
MEKGTAEGKNAKPCPVWKVDKAAAPEEMRTTLKEAIQLLKGGEVVGFPTETVYGLGGSAFSDEAIQKIFGAKGRPSNNPLIVHVSDHEQVLSLVEKRVPEVAKKLMQKFWPGPLTIILPIKKEGNKISKYVTCGMQTVGVRMPSHPIARAIISGAQLPIAAPSANKSGKPSPTAAAHVVEDLSTKISGVVDGGSTGIGLESTVVDCSEAAAAEEQGKIDESQRVVILRPGGVTIEMLKDAVGEKNVSVDPGLKGEEKALKPKSPGMLYTHYAPNAPFVLIQGSKDFFEKTVKDARAEKKKVGVLITEDLKIDGADHVETLARDDKDLETASRKLYGALRAFDQTEVEIIYAPLLGSSGIGAALANRMRKAAGNSVLTE